MRTIVADASILIKWVLPRGLEPDQDAAYAIRDAVMMNKIELLLPSLWIYEVGNTLGRLYPQHAQSMIESLAMLGFSEREWNSAWLKRALDLTHRYKVSFYDASYHALAQSENGLYITADSQYLKKVAGAKSVLDLNSWTY